MLKLSKVSIRFLLPAFLIALLSLPAGASLHLQADREVAQDVADKEPVIRHAVDAVPIQAQPDGAKTRIHPAVIDLTLLGPPRGKDYDISDLREEILAYIKVDALDPGMYVKPARIRLPSGYVLIQADPEIFVVEIFSDSSSSASGKGRE